ncbi:MAG: serine--tRNA ligase [Candidatus Lokiarchaeota archaeon]|nr:serine--tRNA ligase [Candidatus Lokiarchaeota archaeon]MBD3198469.1 serine--tRNA ligase [Candidatus Lokiarchaeota archaeon]
MLDIELFRDDLDKIIESEKRRFKDPTNAERVLEFDKKWRDVLVQLQDLRKKRNDISRKIGEFKKNGEEKKAQNAIKESTEIKTKIDNLGIKADEFLEKREKYRYIVGNILHSSVPIGEEEESNEIIRKSDDLPKFSFDPVSHVDLVELINGADTSKASEVVGSRFYYLKGDLALLNLALMKFALDILEKKGYTPMWTPFFVKFDVIKAAAELADFEEQLYKIQDEDLYMIATSEQTIAAYHYDEILDPNDLPFKYAGISSCFRREAGSHGKDTLGIFRVHQFEKVEQFIFCKAEDSWKFHEELIENAEAIYKELGLPYRIVSIASGELNDNAAKKYDLEAWFPASNTYRELVSCSNCLDYQARKLKIRMGKVGAQKEKETIHTLNSTAIATERTICCILENYQNKDHSITIPKVLRSYMNGKEKIPAIEKKL